MIEMKDINPMWSMSDAAIDRMINYGLYGLAGRAVRMSSGKKFRIRSRNQQREYRREECQYESYADDWEREGDNE